MLNPRLRGKDSVKRVSAAQDVLLAFKSDNTDRVTAFGPALSRMYNLQDCADTVVMHRLTKNIGLIDETVAATRRKASIASMLAYDADASYTLPRSFDLPQDVIGPFYRAKDFLNKLRFKRTYRFVPPSNETLVSSGGNVSLFEKMQDEEQWRVSSACVVEAAKICWHNAQLKRLIKRRFRLQHAWKHMSDLFYVKHGNAFGCFLEMFKTLVIIDGVSRIATVPKDSSVDRVITCEPLWNMVVQLSIAQDLRDALYRTYGIDLSSLQTLHKTLIRHDRFATIDFSNASNSNWWDCVKALFPERILKHLRVSRTGLAQSEGDEYHPLNMMAPMGCGFTFEVMTLTLLAYGRAFCPSASVYGDDVIIRWNKANEFIDFVKRVGWRVNVGKTFVSGAFRESCGGFHHLPTSTDIVCFEADMPKDIFDVITLCNKLYKILLARQISTHVRWRLNQLWERLSKLVNRVSYVTYSPSLEVGCGLLMTSDEVERAPSLLSTVVSKQLHTTVFIDRLQYRHVACSVPVEGRITSYVQEFVFMFSRAQGFAHLKKTKLITQACSDTGERYVNLTLFSVP